MAQQQVIAIVDDDALIRESLKDLLDSAGYSSVVFSSAQRFLKSKRLDRFACLITDMRMPRTTGIELHQAYRRRPRDSHDPHHRVSGRHGSCSSG
jgi:FixJ family two-component response regulator